jgi:hypothetical protein
MLSKNVIQVSHFSSKSIYNSIYFIDYKPKFAEPFSSKRHRDAEEILPSSASLYGAVSPPYRQKMPINRQHSSPSSNSTDRRPSPPPLLPLPSRSLSHNKSSLLSYN